MKHKFNLVLLLLVVFIPSIAFAQIGISPAKNNNKMSFRISPGNSTTTTISLLNATSIDITAHLYAADGTKTGTGQFAAKLPTEEQIAMGTWITFEEDYIDLLAKGDPGYKKEIQVTISVPENIPPGDYSGAIAVERSSEAEKKAVGSMGVQLKTRVIQPVYVNVPGDRDTILETGNLTHKVKGKSHYFDLELSNEGNTAIKADINTKIVGFWGLTTEELPINNIILYKDDKATVPIQWNKNPFFGFYNAEISIDYFEHDVLNNNTIFVDNIQRSLSFSIIPWLTIIVLLVLILILVALFIVKNNKFKKTLKSCKEYIVKPGDTIEKLAKDRNIPWKLLIKLNKLTPPYSLTPDQKIQLPPKNK